MNSGFKGRSQGASPQAAVSVNGGTPLRTRHQFDFTLTGELTGTIAEVGDKLVLTINAPATAVEKEPIANHACGGL